MADAAETTVDEAAPVEAEVEEDFDKERALRTIRSQREAEKALKSELAEAKAAQEELAAIKAAEAEKTKSAEDKLAEARATIKALENRIAEDALRRAFEAEAAERGYDDPKLAFLAAQKEGLLGKVDPKTGEVVTGHNFDKLEEMYPTFRGEGGDITGGAGVRSKGNTQTVNSQFNRTVREALRR